MSDTPVILARRPPGPGGWVPQQAPQATSAASRAALSRLCRPALHVYVPGRRAAESDAHSEADSHRGTLAALKTQAAGSVSDRPHRARRLPAPGPGRVTGPTSRRNCVQRPHEPSPAVEHHHREKRAHRPRAPGLATLNWSRGELPTGRTRARALRAQRTRRGCETL